MQVLLPKLREDNPHVASSVLGALGELSLAGGEKMKVYLNMLMPIIIDNLPDQSSSKREVAIRTLGQFASNLGYVIKPYSDYPQLLDMLLSGVKTENNKIIRREVIRAIGLLGVLDPYKYKKGKQSQEATGKAQIESDNNTTAASANEKYYPTVAINALVRVMRDPSLSMHYRSVIESLMPILQSLGSKSSAFLPEIMGPFLQIIRNSDPNFRDLLFEKLGIIATTVKHGIRYTFL